MSTDELDDVIEGKRTVADFLLYLDSDQKKLVDWALKGPTLVKGGAGSGKSTVALYRVRELVKQSSLQMIKPKILFTTYTNALVNSSQSLLSHLIDFSDADLRIATIDSVIREIVVAVDGADSVSLADQRTRHDAVLSGISNAQIQGDNQLDQMLLKNQIHGLPVEYLLDEFSWVIEGQGIQSEEEYLHANRAGRGYAFNENMRRNIWQVYRGYCRFLTLRQEQSWDQMRLRALEILLNGEWPGDKYDYVLIDEAQDLTPICLSVCVELCQSPAGLYLTADSGQSIYNKGFAWSHVHDQLQVRGRTRILKRNYRTTRQIAQAANVILQSAEGADREVLDQFYVHVGPAPQYLVAGDEEEMMYWLYKRVQAARQELHAPLAAAAVLCATNQQAQQVAGYFNRQGLPTAAVKSNEFNLEDDCVKAITMYTAKGLEFPIVAIPYVEEGVIPREHDSKAEDLSTHLSQQRRLLYVACSRAMRRLFITFRGDRQSRFLEDLSSWQQGSLFQDEEQK